MKGRILITAVLFLAFACCIPCNVQAGPLGIFPNFHPVQKLGQGAKRVARGAKNVAAVPVKATKAARGRRANRGC